MSSTILGPFNSEISHKLDCAMDLGYISYLDDKDKCFYFSDVTEHMQDDAFFYVGEAEMVFADLAEFLQHLVEADEATQSITGCESDW